MSFLTLWGATVGRLRRSGMYVAVPRAVDTGRRVLAVRWRLMGLNKMASSLTLSPKRAVFRQLVQMTSSW